MVRIEKRNRDGQLRWYARHRDPDGPQPAGVFGRRAGVVPDVYLLGTQGASE